MRRLMFLLVLVSISLNSGGSEPTRVRIATFNVAMGLSEAGQLSAALASVHDQRLRQAAEIIRRVQPDILLLTEFDYDPSVDAATLLNDNYLARQRPGFRPIRYPYHFRASVNTGVASGLDLDGDGTANSPEDAWGFGRFPGQYGMLLLSRYPLRTESARTFSTFRWSALPDARRPMRPDGDPFHPDETWAALRLSSKSHWDVVADIEGQPLHVLAFHPTPPVFDGPEDRNGARNADEIRFWKDYTGPGAADYIVDDAGVSGGITAGAAFIVLGDLNADPVDGDAAPGAAGQLLDAAWIDATCTPTSDGGVQATGDQGGANLRQAGDPAADTSDFDDEHTGNLRLDYVLPSKGLHVRGCGVYWPAKGDRGSEVAEAFDHRLAWLDFEL